MATTNFVNYQTIIQAEWLNDVDRTQYEILDNAQNADEARTALGVSSSTVVNAKADKDTDAVENNIAIFNSSGNPVDSGTALSDKADSTIGQGVHTIGVPAAAMISTNSNGAAVGTVVGATNGHTMFAYDFDASTEEAVEFDIIMPKSWNEGTLTAVVGWSHDNTTSNFAVVWGIKMAAIGNGDSLDPSWGTEVTVTDVGGASATLFHSDETTEITPSGTPAEGDLVRVRLSRKAASGSDTMAIDAHLHTVKILFTTDAATDD